MVEQLFMQVFMRRALCLLALVASILTACDGSSMSDDDGGEPGVDGGAGGRDGAGPDLDGASATLCTRDRDCDDEVFCNGREACDPGDPTSDELGCVPAPRGPCTGGACDEETGTCGSGCPDADGDGHESVACGGADCDDTDPARDPDATEVCDVLDVDEDCDPTTFGFRDADADGAPDDQCCNVDEEDIRSCGTDCDDGAAGVNPTNPEICDGIDNNCDGVIDDVEMPVSWYADADDDGHGDPTDAVLSCVPVEGRVLVADDCDDTDGTRYPLANEECDGLDDDCDTGVDEEILGAIGTECVVPAALGVCARGALACAGVAGLVCQATATVSAETCNGLNDDCDGATDEGVPGVGAGCTVAGAYGDCAAGTVTCQGASGTACNGPVPRSEICSAANENCDSSGDGYDGLTCRPGQTSSCTVCPGYVTPGQQACDAGCGWGTCVSTGYSGAWNADSSIFTNGPASTAELRVSSGLYSWRWSAGPSSSANLILSAAIGVLPPGAYRATVDASHSSSEAFRIRAATPAGDLATADLYASPFVLDFRVDACRAVTLYFNSYFYYASGDSGRLYSLAVTRTGN